MIILSKLIINNFAIIKYIAINFNNGFTTVTGETGAGKSIIINAIHLAMGEKADISKIRSGSDQSEIECVFTFDNLPENFQKFIEIHDIPLINNQLVLKRKLFSSGRSTAWINNKTCSNLILKQAGNFLVDLHGQHAHQSLLQEENHLSYLDSYGKYTNLLDKVRITWEKVVYNKNKLDLLFEKQKLNKEKRELWRYQFDEIEKISPKENEINDLVKEIRLLENAEKFIQIAKGLTNQLYEGENTFYNQIQDVIGKLQELNSIKDSFGDYLENLEQTKYLFQELSNDLNHNASSVEYDSSRLDELNTRLISIDKLVKKYGPEIQNVLEFQENLKIKLSEDENLDFDINDISKKLDHAKSDYLLFAQKLSAERKKYAVKFEKAVETSLNRLGVIGSKFSIKINHIESNTGLYEFDGKKYNCNELGIDKISFHIRTNPGEPISPLVDIASGGEVSRIMLAMKSILAAGDKIPVLIFDEIDTGISGQIARIVGEEMRKLSKSHQILCITHLPQIASLGDEHFVVRKVSDEKRNTTVIEKLDKINRIHEIAKLIGGKDISESGLSQASELIS